MEHTHTPLNYHSRRGVPSDASIIIAVPVAILVLGIIALLARRGLRRSVPAIRGHKFISAPTDVERFESSTAFVAATRATRYENPKFYQQAPHSMHTDTLRDPPMNWQHVHPASRILSALEAPGFTRSCRRHKVVSQSVIPSVPNDGTCSGLALRRTNSIDAITVASTWTSASAPLEFHEHLFRSPPLILDPTAPRNAPVWIPSVSKVPTLTTAEGTVGGLVVGVCDTRGQSSHTKDKPYDEPGNSSADSSRLGPTSFDPLPVPCPAHTRSNFRLSATPPRISWVAPKRGSGGSVDHSPVPSFSPAPPFASPLRHSVDPPNNQARSGGPESIAAAIPPDHSSFALSPTLRVPGTPPKPPVRSSRRPSLVWGLPNEFVGAFHPPV